MMVKMPQINFVHVSNNQIKLAQICAIVQRHFEQGESLLITLPNTEAAQYIDQLLWKMPEESFIPHQIATSPTQEKIVMTTLVTNVNGATILFNLNPGASPIAKEFEIVYELYDETHPTKLELSKQRLEAYQKEGLEVSSQAIGCQII